MALTLGAPAALADSDPVDYVALGDSYASGTGIGNYHPDSGGCQRSPGAYPELWAAANDVSSFTFAACSGAVTDDVIGNQLGGLNAETDLVSLSIGGNDAGFVEVISTCTLLTTEACRAAVDRANTFIEADLPTKLDNTYGAIGAAAPNAQVVVLGYPRLYELGGNCIISETKRTMLNETADLLSDVTAARVSAAGYSYVDVRDTFAGRGVCSSSPWINGVYWPLGESFHPNAAGHTNAYLPAFSAAAPTSSAAVLAAG